MRVGNIMGAAINIVTSVFSGIVTALLVMIFSIYLLMGTHCIRRNNLPDIHLHDLRHTAATLMIEEQCPITAVAGTLGHAPPATTTTIYAHALRRANAKTANVMQNLFEKKKIS